MHPTRRAVLLAPAFAALAMQRPARAQALGALRQRGWLNVGVLQDFAPFGSLNQFGDPVGFEVDVAALIGRHLSVRVRHILLTAGERMGALVDGRVDVIAAQFGITTGRALSVAFATPHLLTECGLFAAKDRAIKQVEDLAALRLGVVWGSPADLFLTTAMGQKAEILRFETDGAVFAALAGKVVDVISQAVPGAAAYAAAHPDADMQLKLVLFSAADALAVHPDAVALRHWLNTFVLFTRETGELGAIWQKWLGRPMPDLPVL
jgi:polar amino acid transport system substrate-binding protein